MMHNFNGQRVYIAPHTPRTTMFQKTFSTYFPDAIFLGFLDKVKKADDICAVEEIIHTSYDAILILSQNHFESIYAHYSRIIPLPKLYKVDIIDNRYIFFDRRTIFKQKLLSLSNRCKLAVLTYAIKLINWLKLPRKKTVFLAKSFTGTNTKMLYLYGVAHHHDVILLSDNIAQCKELKKYALPFAPLFSWRAIKEIAFAKIVIQDQGNYTAPLLLLSPQQQTIQMWHGIPLKRMNLLTNITYDALISPSDYVNKTSLNHVIQAKHSYDFGYPRNDLVLKEHTSHDLLFCDQDLYYFAKSHFGTAQKVIVYMPTHRESATEIGASSIPLIPLDFYTLDLKLKALNSFLIVKLHPFVMQFYQSFSPQNGYERILFHSAQGDIYPILKYTDILITDYSSVYFDFLLLKRPILFFDYDYEEYSGNMGGFVYNYHEVATGEKVKTQSELEQTLASLLQGNDTYHEMRQAVLNQFYTFHDAHSSRRITEALLASSQPTLNIPFGSRIIIAPYSTMSAKLKEHLILHYRITFLGFIDSTVKNDETVDINTLATVPTDLLLIISPNHALDIYKSLKKSVPQKKIRFITFNKHFASTTWLHLRLQRTAQSFFLKLLIFVQTSFKHLFEDTNTFLFLAPDFIDLNLKELYLYMSDQKGIKPVIATNNQDHLKQFRSVGFHVISMYSLAFIFYSLKSRWKILDHTPLLQPFYASLIHSKVLQIWHGIPLKKIGHLADYKKVTYDIVVSTSDFISEKAFANVFNAKEIINSGYPRNDILLRDTPKEKSLIGVHHDIYHFVQTLTSRVIIYMPTWRATSFEQNPIDLAQFNQFAKENNLFIIIKMHPFIWADSFFGTTNRSHYTYRLNFAENILFYPSGDDIYPLLRKSSLLITDYSSIYFDYLLIDKPIIFFIYDYEEYKKTQGEFMLPFDEFTPGAKPKTFEELKISILHVLKEDTHQYMRQKLLEILFDKESIGKSSHIIFEAMMKTS